MRRTILAAVPLAVLALAAPAAADGGGKHATTYRAELAPVVAGPVATPTRNEDEAAKGVRGKAKLVDAPAATWFASTSAAWPRARPTRGRCARPPARTMRAPARPSTRSGPRR